MKKSKKLIALAAALALTVGGAVSVSAGTANYAGNLAMFGSPTTLTEGTKNSIYSMNATTNVNYISNNYSSFYAWVDDTATGNLRTLQHVRVSKGSNTLKYANTWGGGARLRGDSGNSMAAYTVWVEGSVNFG